MIIDGDCHLSARPDGFEISPDQLVALLDENGVDKVVSWPMVSYQHEVADDNAAISAGAKRYPDRIVPFGGINPRLGLTNALDELTRCTDFGFRGIKLNGARDVYYIDDPKISLPVIEQIAARGMVLALHCGSNDFERTHPYRVAKIAATFPELPILMIHMGGAGLPTLHAAAIEFAAQHSNILIVDSEAQPNAILDAIRTLGAERVCYGSDAPFQPMRVMFAMHQALLRDLSTEQRELVMGENIRRLLAL